MPIYDYRCLDCGHEFQVIERISEHETEPHACPKCESEKLERVLEASFVKTTKKS